MTVITKTRFCRTVKYGACRHFTSKCRRADARQNLYRAATAGLCLKSLRFLPFMWIRRVQESKFTVKVVKHVHVLAKTVRCKKTTSAVHKGTGSFAVKSLRYFLQCTYLNLNWMLNHYNYMGTEIEK